jgi:hypothetical protein
VLCPDTNAMLAGEEICPAVTECLEVVLLDGREGETLTLANLVNDYMTCLKKLSITLHVNGINHDPPRAVWRITPSIR